MKNIIVLVLLFTSIYAHGQSQQEQAIDLTKQAIKEMDAGYIDQSLNLLKRAKKLDPLNLQIDYEIAYAHYLDKDYKSAIKVLDDLSEKWEQNGIVFQMLGNCYDLIGKRKKAIVTYDKGLEKFPNTGILYLERGNMELFDKNYNEALFYYEKGIEVDPSFPSNYYWAAKIFLGSTEEVWGMIYGELFMNLERNTARTAEMSRLLFNIYKSEIEFVGDTSISVSFSKNNTINITDLTDPDQLKLPYGLMIYEQLMMKALIGESEITIGSLSNVRQRFAKQYFDGKSYEEYPNVLFDFHKTLINEGLFDAYTHWILMKGDEDEFSAWKVENEISYKRFIDWFSENKLEIDETNLFFRSQY
ncbi:MAG: tetratricopeptide repeat protein [Bacteroidia bacterium]